MNPEFDPIPTADAWQLSNPPILSLAPYLASLDLFEEVGMPKLVDKQKKLTAYLEFILSEIDREVDSWFEVITPADRGCQLSVFLHGEGRPLFDYLMKNGVITDWREPNVIRLAPVPLYTSYTDIYRFGQVLKAGIREK
jgi:kynureninase